jgi:hypothetical protein
VADHRGRVIRAHGGRHWAGEEGARKGGEVQSGSKRWAAA